MGRGRELSVTEAEARRFHAPLCADRSWATFMASYTLDSIFATTYLRLDTPASASMCEAVSVPYLQYNC